MNAFKNMLIVILTCVITFSQCKNTNNLEEYSNKKSESMTTSFTGVLKKNHGQAKSGDSLAGGEPLFWSEVKTMINENIENRDRTSLKITLSPNPGSGITSDKDFVLRGFMVDVASLQRMILEQAQGDLFKIRQDVQGVYIMPAVNYCNAVLGRDVPAYRTMILGTIKNNQLDTRGPFMDFFEPCPKLCEINNKDIWELALGEPNPIRPYETGYRNYDSIPPDYKPCKP